ncbi:MAG: hypothetical protein RLZZ117_2063 [Cyanobacteriota bacterium]|jgi:hypothetical protein
MGNHLCLVQATDCGCLIYREITGCYVVTHQNRHKAPIRVATLPGAYAMCEGWHRRSSLP